MLEFIETLRGNVIPFGRYLSNTKMKTYEYSRKETGMTIKQDLKAAQKEFKELGKKHRKGGQGN